MSINTHLSDLFFNHDISECKEFVNGQFSHFNHDKMLEQASSVIGSLKGMGVVVEHSAEELVQDFYKRV